MYNHDVVSLLELKDDYQSQGRRLQTVTSEAERALCPALGRRSHETFGFASDDGMKVITVASGPLIQWRQLVGMYDAFLVAGAAVRRWCIMSNYYDYGIVGCSRCMEGQFRAPIDSCDPSAAAETVD